METNKITKVQMWLACLLTMGEWTIAVYVVFHSGDLVMIYLAVTYALRETKGGKHYHEIVMDAMYKLHPHWFHRKEK